VSRDDLRPRLDDLTRLLAEEYADVYDRATVARCVAEARAQLGDARIVAYLPMFVARRARDLLLSKPADAPVG
jgi:hypothetical protein